MFNKHVESNWVCRLSYLLLLKGPTDPHQAALSLSNGLASSGKVQSQICKQTTQKFVEFWGFAFSPIDVVQLQNLRSRKLRIVARYMGGSGSFARIFPLRFDHISKARVFYDVVLIVFQSFRVSNYLKKSRKSSPSYFPNGKLLPWYQTYMGCKTRLSVSSACPTACPLWPYQLTRWWILDMLDIWGQLYPVKHRMSRLFASFASGGY